MSALQIWLLLQKSQKNLQTGIRTPLCSLTLFASHIFTPNNPFLHFQYNVLLSAQSSRCGTHILWERFGIVPPDATQESETTKRWHRRAAGTAVTHQINPKVQLPASKTCDLGGRSGMKICESEWLCKDRKGWEMDLQMLSEEMSLPKQHLQKQWETRMILQDCDEPRAGPHGSRASLSPSW